jgi:hypothetical protein
MGRMIVTGALLAAPVLAPNERHGHIDPGSYPPAPSVGSVNVFSTASGAIVTYSDDFPDFRVI